jgi:hypothetical protein
MGQRTPAGDDMSIYHRLMPSDCDGPPNAPDSAMPGLTQTGDQKSADTLRISPARLRSASRAASGLEHATKNARGRLQQAHDSLPTADSGFSVLGALASVHASWDGRLADVTKDCAEISDLFTTAAKDHEATDQAVHHALLPQPPDVIPTGTGGPRPRSS